MNFGGVLISIQTLNFEAQAYFYTEPELETLHLIPLGTGVVRIQIQTQIGHLTFLWVVVNH